METSLAMFICCMYEAFSTDARSHDNQLSGCVTNKQRNGNAGARLLTHH